MIREYCSPKYKYIKYNNNMNLKKTSDYLSNPWNNSYDEWIESLVSAIKDEMYYDNFIENTNKKHPSTYQNGIKKLNK